MKKRYFKTFLLGVGLSLSTLLPISAEAPREAVRQPLAELFVQTSAEYRGLCYQTYAFAAFQFDNWAPLLEKRADGKAYLPGSTKPVAVVLDLDETVIDNSGFQAFSVRTGTSFNPELWDAWVNFQGVNEEAGRMVPGATEFLLKMEEMGVTPFYVSNRTVGQEAPTIKVLERAGLDTTDIADRVMLKMPGDGEDRRARDLIKTDKIEKTSMSALQLLRGEGEKESRRHIIKKKYDVLAYFGDVYGDFKPFLEMAGTSKRLFEQRQESADKNQGNWGNVWYILPNPMYGPWSVGSAIPKDEVKSSLNDYGFEVYLRGRRLVK